MILVHWAYSWMNAAGRRLRKTAPVRFLFNYWPYIVWFEIIFLGLLLKTMIDSM